jgi:hypothetical protein
MHDVTARPAGPGAAHRGFSSHECLHPQSQRILAGGAQALRDRAPPRNGGLPASREAAASARADVVAQRAQRVAKLVNLVDDELARAFAGLDDLVLELLEARLELVQAIACVHAGEMNLDLDLVREALHVAPC